MIKKLICKIFGHEEDSISYKHKVVDLDVKLVIPTKFICPQCNKLLTRNLYDFELEAVVKGSAILE